MSPTELVEIIRLIASYTMVWAGLFFVVVGAVGVVRFPDFYTRLHAAGVTDTLGAELVLAGLIVQADSITTMLKLALIALFLFLTSPTSTHAIANAAYTAGVKPRLGPARQGDGAAPDAAKSEGDAT